MEDIDFSDEFCAFVQASVPSVQAAELLVVLHNQPERWWDAPELVAQAGGLAEAEALRLLELFKTRGLLAAGPDKRVQFRPANPYIGAQAAKLAQAYLERPVTLIRMIYALRDTRIRSFADAFKLKRGK